jgi:hypothetical protein
MSAANPGTPRRAWRAVRGVITAAGMKLAHTDAQWRQSRDLAPLPLYRWLIVVGLLIWRWAAGIPSSINGWLGVLVISVVMILPDAASIAFGGLQIEMRQAKEQVADLKQQVSQLQIQQAAAAAAQASSGHQFIVADQQLAERLVRSATATATSVAAGEDAGSSVPDWLDGPTLDAPPVDPDAPGDVPSQS